MRLVNYVKRLDTKELQKELYHIAKIAGVSLRGTYVQVMNAKYSAVGGRCYSDATAIYRKGHFGPIKVNGYIKLYVFSYTTLDELRSTFAHELSHLDDWRGYGTKIPRNQEKRARAFACAVMEKVNKEGM